MDLRAGMANVPFMLALLASSASLHGTFAPATVSAQAEHCEAAFEAAREIDEATSEAACGEAPHYAPDEVHRRYRECVQPLHEAAGRELARVTEICRAAAVSAEVLDEQVSLTATAIWSAYRSSLHLRFPEWPGEPDLRILEDGIAEIETLDPSSSLAIAMLDEIAYRLTGQPREARVFLTESAELRRRAHGAERLEYARGVFWLGVHYGTLGVAPEEIEAWGLDDERAEAMWLEALGILEALSESDRLRTETYSSVLFALDHLYESQGRTAAANLVGEKRTAFLERAEQLSPPPAWLVDPADP